jgi:hypothetical protein
MSPWGRELVTATAVRRVANLIVILQKNNKLWRRQVERRRSSRATLPLAPLTLIQVTPFDR